MKRILVAGAGLIGSRHIDEVRRSSDCVLAGIIEPEAGRCTGMSEPVFLSLDAVDIEADGIILATPTALHASQAVEALNRGWHVLVEKPVADTVEAAMAMQTAAQAAGREILVGHHRRHHPRVARAKQLLDAGAVGMPLLASCLWTVKKPDDYFKGNWRSGAQGSPVHINAIHDVDMLRHFFGEVASIAAFGAGQVRRAGRVETIGVTMQFESGCVATLALSDVSPGSWGFELGTGENPNIGSTGQDMLFISGTEGALAFPSLAVWSGSPDWSVAPVPHREAAGDDDGTPLQRQLRHFVAVMDGTAAPLVSAADAARTLAAIVEIEKQAGGSGRRAA